jgi:hypothetical protein
MQRAVSSFFVIAVVQKRIPAGNIAVVKDEVEEIRFRFGV